MKQEKLRARSPEFLHRLINFARLFALCPCCEEMEQCHVDCTYATDASSSDYEQMVIARDVLRELPSEPIYGQWFNVADVPITTDPDAWIVTAQTWTETAPVTEPRTVTVFSKPRLAPYVDREHVDAWLRIPPPPWLAGK